MTKHNLLKLMGHYGACLEARNWVLYHRKKSAREIFLDCDRLDWLIWFLLKLGRLNRFARVAARRAGFKRGDTYWYSVRNDCANAYALHGGSERERQLKALHRIALDWLDGKPAEK